MSIMDLVKKKMDKELEDWKVNQIVNMTREIDTLKKSIKKLEEKIETTKEVKELTNDLSF